MNNIDSKLASLKSRTLAFLIDDLIVSFIIMFIFWDTVVSLSSNPEALVSFIQNGLFMPLILLKVTYHTFFIWYYGATLGKMLVKIRVVDMNTLSRVTLLSSLFRAIGRIFSEMFFYVGFVISLFNKERKTFHDIVAKTLVVNV